MSEDFEYKVTTIKTSGYTRCGNVSTYWESEPKVIDMSQYIPIEWIRNELSKYEYVNRLEYSYCGKSGVEVLSKLLKDWEKENEIQI